jgi:uncharacterized repeat protein (TIGR01451 family)
MLIGALRRNFRMKICFAIRPFSGRSLLGPRSMKWFLGTLLLLLVAFILDSGLLAFAGYVLMALMAVTRLMARSWVDNLHAERFCNFSTAEVGESVSVRLTVQNNGPLPVPWVLLEDMLPAKALFQTRARLKVRKRRQKIAMIGIQGSTTMEYEVEFKMRGYYQLGPLVVESGDLFGLHRRYQVGTAPHFVLVYPKVLPLEGYDLASRRPVGEIRLTHRLFEDPTRLGGVRQYEAGDPLNRVHWRATARTGMLHSKIYEASTIAGATILLDFHQAGYPSRGEPFRSELAVTTAATLAHTLFQMGQQVGLATNGRDAADRIRVEGWAHDYRTRAAALASAAEEDESDRLQPIVLPTRRGIESFQRILESLARLELTDGLDIAHLIAETQCRLPRDATVIAIVGDASEQTALALGILRRQGYAVTAVLIILDEEQEAIAHGKLRSQNIEVRHVRDELTLTALCQRFM